MNGTMEGLGLWRLAQNWGSREGGEAEAQCQTGTHLAAKRRAMPLSAAARNASTSSAGGDLPIFPFFGLRNT